MMAGYVMLTVEERKSQRVLGPFIPFIPAQFVLISNVIRAVVKFDYCTHTQSLIHSLTHCALQKKKYVVVRKSNANLSLLSIRIEIEFKNRMKNQINSLRIVFMARSR